MGNFNRNLAMPDTHIISYLLFNYPFEQNYGLLEGQMGGVLFFSLYAEMLSNRQYREFALSLFEDVSDKIHENTPITFGNGLSGIGWAVDFLISNNLQPGDPDEILEDIDRIVQNFNPKYCNDLSIETGVSGILVYLISRLKNYHRGIKPSSLQNDYLFEIYQVCRYVKELPVSNSMDRYLISSYMEAYDKKIINLTQVNHCLFQRFTENLPTVKDDEIALLPLGIRGLTGILIKKYMDEKLIHIFNK